MVHGPFDLASVPLKSQTCDSTSASPFAMDDYSFVELTDITGAKGSNWGNKFEQEAKWLRKDKLSSWSPHKEEWEVSRCFLLLLLKLNFYR